MDIFTAAIIFFGIVALAFEYGMIIAREMTFDALIEYRRRLRDEDDAGKESVILRSMQLFERARGFR